MEREAGLFAKAPGCQTTKKKRYQGQSKIEHPCAFTKCTGLSSLPTPQAYLNWVFNPEEGARGLEVYSFHK